MTLKIARGLVLAVVGMSEIMGVAMGPSQAEGAGKLSRKRAQKDGMQDSGSRAPHIGSRGAHKGAKIEREPTRRSAVEDVSRFARSTLAVSKKTQFDEIDCMWIESDVLAAQSAGLRDFSHDAEGSTIRRASTAFNSKSVIAIKKEGHRMRGSVVFK